MIAAIYSFLPKNFATPFFRTYSSTWNHPNDIKKYLWKTNFRIDKTRCYFPRPNENMRIKKHGWNARMSTEGGRKVLMNRILKGRHVLSH